MSSEASDEMLLLLKELSVYKAMDDDFRAGSEGPEGIVASEAYDERERRRLKIKEEDEIKQEMHDLALESKKARA